MAREHRNMFLRKIIIINKSNCTKSETAPKPHAQTQSERKFCSSRTHSWKFTMKLRCKTIAICFRFVCVCVASLWWRSCHETVRAPLPCIKRKPKNRFVYGNELVGGVYVLIYSLKIISLCHFFCSLVSLLLLDFCDRLDNSRKATFMKALVVSVWNSDLKISFRWRIKAQNYLDGGGGEVSRPIRSILVFLHTYKHWKCEFANQTESNFFSLGRDFNWQAIKRSKTKWFVVQWAEYYADTFFTFQTIRFFAVIIIFRLLFNHLTHWRACNFAIQNNRMEKLHLFCCFLKSEVNERKRRRLAMANDGFHCIDSGRFFLLFSKWIYYIC